ncbi:Progestin and adipoQ receptor family member 3 [Nymphon striatum]|nr:Progestin and adipoQ receptor family member 3 [Nymphon striatum]
MGENGLNIDDAGDETTATRMKSKYYAKHCCTRSFCNNSQLIDDKKDFLHCSLPSRKMLKYDLIPDFLKGNPYIQCGYRRKLSAIECVNSLWWWNNETINVWSHIIGFLAFSMLMVYDLLYFLPSVKVSLEDYFVLTFALFSYQIAMLLSACYHLFSCVSENVHDYFLCLDLSGILLSFSSVFFSGIFFAFHCCPEWKVVYSLLIGCFSFLVLILTWHPQSMSPEYSKLRCVVFGFWALCGIFPTFHWIYIKNGFSNHEVQQLFPNIVIMYLISAAGFIFYLCKIPERFFPGKFDIIGSSHQLWHLLVFISLVWWHKTGVKYIYVIHSSSCVVNGNCD